MILTIRTPTYTSRVSCKTARMVSDPKKTAGTVVTVTDVIFGHEINVLYRPFGEAIDIEAQADVEDAAQQAQTKETKCNTPAKTTPTASRTPPT